MGHSASPSLLQERGPLSEPETGLLSNTQNELSEETHVLPKQEILLERVLHHVAHSLGFYGDGISFPVVFSPSF